MCAERADIYGARLFDFKGHYSIEKTYNFTHTLHTHMHTHLHECMWMFACVYICMHVNIIWMDMNLMLYMDLNLVNMVNTVTEP